MFVFRKIWRALFSWNTRFEICPFALLPTTWQDELKNTQYKKDKYNHYEKKILSFSLEVNTSLYIVA